MMNLAISFLLNLSLFALVEAAPMSVASAKPWQAGTGGGIVGFIVLVLDIIAWSTLYAVV
jgi:prepilin signal peptidase PulO-like enzyme (type II secretory pathway)